jgi:hypothetical protein
VSQRGRALPSCANAASEPLEPPASHRTPQGGLDRGQLPRPRQGRHPAHARRRGPPEVPIAGAGPRADAGRGGRRRPWHCRWHRRRRCRGRARRGGGGSRGRRGRGCTRRRRAGRGRRRRGGWRACGRSPPLAAARAAGSVCGCGGGRAGGGGGAPARPPAPAAHAEGVPGEVPRRQRRDPGAAAPPRARGGHREGVHRRGRFVRQRAQWWEGGGGGEGEGARQGLAAARRPRSPSARAPAL